MPHVFAARPRPVTAYLVNNDSLSHPRHSRARSHLHSTCSHFPDQNALLVVPISLSRASAPRVLCSLAHCRSNTNKCNSDGKRHNFFLCAFFLLHLKQRRRREWMSEAGGGEEAEECDSQVCVEMRHQSAFVSAESRHTSAP